MVIIQRCSLDRTFMLFVIGHNTGFDNIDWRDIEV